MDEHNGLDYTLSLHDTRVNVRMAIGGKLRIGR